MDIEKIRELVRILESSSLAEIHIEEDGESIHLKKPQAQAPMNFPYPPMGQLENQGFVYTGQSHGGGSSTVDSDIEETDEDLVTIDSPMVGTFFAAPSPDAEPFVKVGDNVSEGDTVCIVEAMKLMNEVTAKFAAKIEKILVENGEPVEYGQALFAVRPA